MGLDWWRMPDSSKHSPRKSVSCNLWETQDTGRFSRTSRQSGASCPEFCALCGVFLAPRDATVPSFLRGPIFSRNCVLNALGAREVPEHPQTCEGAASGLSDIRALLFELTQTHSGGCHRFEFKFHARSRSAAKARRWCVLDCGRRHRQETGGPAWLLWNRPQLFLHAGGSGDFPRSASTEPALTTWSSGRELSLDVAVKKRCSPSLDIKVMMPDRDLVTVRHCSMAHHSPARRRRPVVAGQARLVFHGCGAGERSGYLIGPSTLSATWRTPEDAGTACVANTVARSSCAVRKASA